MSNIDLLDFLVRLLDDHNNRVVNHKKRMWEQERKVDRRAGELLCQRRGLSKMDKILADRLRLGEITRNHAGFCLPSQCLTIVDGEIKLAWSISKIEKVQPPKPPIREWMQEEIHRAEEDLEVQRDNGLPWWVANSCDEVTPWDFIVGEILKNFTCDCDATQLRQQIEEVRVGQITETNDISIELARLNEQEGFVKKILDKVVLRYPELHKDEKSQKLLIESGHAEVGSSAQVIRATRDRTEKDASRAGLDDDHHGVADSAVVPYNFQHSGEIWNIAFDSTRFLLGDVKGLHLIHHLLSNPTKEIHVIELESIVLKTPKGGARSEAYALEQGLKVSGQKDAGPLLDETAKRKYQQRIDDLDDEIREAERNNDLGSLDKAKQEKDSIVQQLAASVGFGGRDRKIADEHKKITDRVCKNISNVLKKIGNHNDQLWRHLSITLKLGTFCSYRPEKPIPWEL